MKEDVEARTTSEEDWQAAAEGDQLTIGGGAKTGDEARVRIDISDGTIIRVAGNSLFTLAELSPAPTDSFTRFRLDAGKLWVQVLKALGNGAFEIETPVGSATVRGSLMSAEYDPDTGQMTVTCLEGACRLIGSSGQFTDITEGEQAEIPSAGQDPTPAHLMDAAELAEWEQEVPEAQTAVLAVAALVPTHTPTPDVSPTPTEIPGPNAFIASEGTVSASSTFSGEFPATLVEIRDTAPITVLWHSFGA